MSYFFDTKIIFLLEVEIKDRPIKQVPPVKFTSLLVVILYRFHFNFAHSHNCVFFFSGGLLEFYSGNFAQWVRKQEKYILTILVGILLPHLRIFLYDA